MKSKKRFKKGTVGAVLASTFALAVLASPFHASAVPIQGKEYDNLISTAGNTSFAVMADGSAFYSAGSNFNGSLGAGASSTGSTTPIQGVGFDIKMIDAGSDSFHVLLKKDGTVWSWGKGGYGELGTGLQYDSSNEPVQNLFINDVKEVRTDGHTVIFLKNNGTVWSLGHNDHGQLGDGSAVTYSATPVQVQGLTDIISIDAGEEWGAALKSDGTLWVWGSNINGAFGNGTKVDASTPIQYPITNIKAFSAGSNALHVVTNSGEVYGSGSNNNGKLGDGTTTTRVTPVKVNISNVKDVDSGNTATLALKEDGTVWAWGSNLYGQLGNGTTVTQKTPVPVLDTTVSPLTNVVAIDGGDSQSMALKADGTVWTWGENVGGELAIGNKTNQRFATQSGFVNLFN